ncbi:hypothetical protein RQP46_011131 [Phenoliferia psychrophenolica]
MTTISSLPQELLHLILACVHGEEDDDGATAEHRRMLRSLSSASLVTRRWRDPAQALLWSHIMVWKPSHICALLGSESLGRYKTKELDVLGEPAAITPGEAYGGQAGNPGLLFMFIESLEGIESINVDSRLKSLRLDANLEPDRPLLPQWPDFQLTTLDLTSIHRNIHPSVDSFLAHHGGNLERLTFDRTELQLVLPHAPSLSPLKYLSLFLGTREEFEQADEILRTLPAPIEELDLLVAESRMLKGKPGRETQVNMLLERLDKSEWTGLARLDFMEATLADLVALPQGALLAERCGEKGIVLLPVT